MQTVKYRLIEPGLKPRRTKLEVPGWAGSAAPRRNGEHEQVWHCALFAEAAQYGIEVIYPYKNELRVSRRDGQVVLNGDFGPHPEPGSDLQWPPFRSFGAKFYTYQILIDLEVPRESAILTAPHPRYYTGDDVPLAVPGLVRTEWWPMISFVVFRAPPEGIEHVFRPGEPFMQMLIVPAEPDFVLEEMGREKAAEREVRARRIHASRDTLAEPTTWVSATKTVFDGTYRHLLRAAKARANSPTKR